MPLSSTVSVLNAPLSLQTKPVSKNSTWSRCGGAPTVPYVSSSHVILITHWRYSVDSEHLGRNGVPRAHHSFSDSETYSWLDQTYYYWTTRLWWSSVLFKILILILHTDRISTLKSIVRPTLSLLGLVSCRWCIPLQTVLQPPWWMCTTSKGQV